MWIIMTHKSLCVAPHPPHTHTHVFFSSLKKNTIIGPVKERAFGAKGEFFKRALKTNSSSLSVWRALLSVKRTYGRDDVKKILVSIAFWNQAMFLHFTSTSNSLSIIKASVNNQSNEGLWQRAHWKKCTEFGSGTSFLHTWGAGAGACSGGWERMFQRRKVLPLQVISRHHRSSRRTRDRLKHVWTKIIYRDWWPVTKKAKISASTG